MELRTVAFSLLAGLVAFLVTAGAISALALSGHVPRAPDSLAFEFMDFIPAIAMGVTAGRMSRSEPAVNVLVACLLSWVFFAALFFATVDHFRLETRLSAADFLSGYVAPLLVAILAAHVSFSPRRRGNSSLRADPQALRGRERP